ncbi:hypothetical protein Pyn_09852 [Prunus yedoensis var. nudiflora]|uniref:Uncharacterized protein n=1 Tax=Prunus yedoensis var. nudiflora TaxID=2094558 RepID=A0A314UND8_PRUYE|nr:hypothetical protein Pyn_09852 [Prunus yedoensis var. nudiflora]
MKQRDSLTGAGGTSSLSSPSERTRRSLFLGGSGTSSLAVALYACMASPPVASVPAASLPLLRPGAIKINGVRHGSEISKKGIKGQALTVSNAWSNRRSRWHSPERQGPWRCHRSRRP